MYLNGNAIGNGYADKNNTAGQHETFSFQWTLNLQKGDQIWLQIYDMPIGAFLRGGYYDQFSGYLLEENLAAA